MEGGFGLLLRSWLRFLSNFELPLKLGRRGKKEKEEEEEVTGGDGGEMGRVDGQFNTHCTAHSNGYRTAVICIYIIL